MELSDEDEVLTVSEAEAFAVYDFLKSIPLKIWHVLHSLQVVIGIFATLRYLLPEIDKNGYLNCYR
jgi:hypothetical protein